MEKLILLNQFENEYLKIANIKNRLINNGNIKILGEYPVYREKIKDKVDVDINNKLKENNYLDLNDHLKLINNYLLKKK